MQVEGNKIAYQESSATHKPGQEEEEEEEEEEEDPSKEESKPIETDEKDNSKNNEMDTTTVPPQTELHENYLVKCPDGKTSALSLDLCGDAKEPEYEESETTADDGESKKNCSDPSQFNGDECVDATPSACSQDQTLAADGTTCVTKSLSCTTGQVPSEDGKTCINPPLAKPMMEEEPVNRCYTKGETDYFLNFVKHVCKLPAGPSETKSILCPNYSPVVKDWADFAQGPVDECVTLTTKTSVAVSAATEFRKLDPSVMDCAGKILSGFKLVRATAANQFQYQYICMDFAVSGTKETKNSTKAPDNIKPDHHLKNITNDHWTVDGGGQVISKVDMRTYSSWNGDMLFEVYPEPKSLKDTEHYTEYTPYDSSDVKKIDPLLLHQVNCFGRPLTYYRAEQARAGGTDRFRYHYKCGSFTAIPGQVTPTEDPINDPPLE